MQWYIFYIKIITVCSLPSPESWTSQQIPYCCYRFPALPALPLCGVLITSAMWDLCCFSWSPPLRGTFVASVGRLRYVGPLSLQLVASAIWHLCRRSWPLPLCETFDCLCCFSWSWDLCCRSWLLPLRGTYGRLRYVKLSRLYSTWDVFRRRSTWDLYLSLCRFCYVHLFQTGLAWGHAPALLPDRSSLRARTCIASRQV